MKHFFSATVLFLSIVAPAPAQTSEPATQLRKFEIDWLTAGLNGDPKWQQRFLDGKLDVEATDANGVRQRSVNIAELLRTPLSANEVKVRITGTISLLTSDPAKNRSFRFLDTFNKKNGKWQVIATSISPADASTSPATDRRQIEQELTRLENAWAQVGVTNLALIYAGLGDRDQTLNYLEKAYDEESIDLLLAKVDPRLDPFRSEPRFARILTELRFP